MLRMCVYIKQEDYAVIMAVEDAYGITVPEEELPNLTSVKAIVEYVDKNAA